MITISGLQKIDNKLNNILFYVYLLLSSLDGLPIMPSYELFHQHQQQERQAESSLLLKHYDQLCDKWQLSKAEAYRLLNLNSLHQMAHWEHTVSDVSLTDVQIEKLSYLLSIYQILEKHLPKRMPAHQWIREQQTHIPGFLEYTPLELFIRSDKKQLQKLSHQLHICFAD